MIVALDIETIGNEDALKHMPEPKAKKTLKDPAKIAADIAEKKTDMASKAALDPLTARIVCYAAVGVLSPSDLDGTQDSEYVEFVPRIDDDAEREIVQSIFRVLGTEDVRIVTFNGYGFDMPMIYRRAMILGVDPANFDAPPLATWMKKYSHDRHYDLMQIWCGWNGFEGLDTLAEMILGERKTEIDVATFSTLLLTEEGRKQLGDYCLQDTRLTWRLWKKFNGVMFA